MVQAVLFDLDGVFYQGDRAIPGARDALDAVRQRNLPHLLLTNTTSRPRSALVEKLARFDLEVDESDILTPAVAAGDWLRAQRATPVATFLDPHTVVDLGEVASLDPALESGAGAVVVGDLGPAWDFATLNRAFRLLMAGDQTVLVALGMTRYWQAPDGLRLDTAPFVVALEHASGVEPVVAGKPSGLFFQAAVQRLEVPAGEVVMVGDDVRTDVGGAQDAGLAGVLVRTGKFRPADLAGVVRPDAVLDSVAELPAWLDAVT